MRNGRGGQRALTGAPTVELTPNYKKIIEISKDYSRITDNKTNVMSFFFFLQLTFRFCFTFDPCHTVASAQ